MKEIELEGADWSAMKRKLMFGSVEDALKGYTPPVKLIHGNEFIVYETGGEDERPDE